MQRDGGDDGTRRTRSGNEVKSKESGLMDIYRRLRPGEVGTVDSAEKLLHATFFDPKRYDMMRVGRYKYNKKLAIAARIRGHVVDQDIIDPATGEVLIAAGERIPAAKTDPLAKKIQDAGRERHLPPFWRIAWFASSATTLWIAAAWLSEEESKSPASTRWFTCRPSSSCLRPPSRRAWTSWPRSACCTRIFPL